MKRKLLSMMLALCLAAGTVLCLSDTKTVYAGIPSFSDGDFIFCPREGDMDYAAASGYEGTASAVTIPSEATDPEKNITRPVKYFGLIAGWFDDKNACLTEITIPDSITVIGGSALSGCPNLTTVHISEKATKGN